MASGTVPRARAEVLLCPGPVMLSPGVKAALARCEIGHRDARFSELVARLRRNCGLVLGASEGHSVVFITGPATAAIEAACVSLLPPEASVIVPVNGTFGARIAEILKVHDECLASPSISDLGSLSTSHESRRRWLTHVMLDSRRPWR